MQANNGDSPEFTDEQLRAALKGVGRDARQMAFAAGQPVFILKGDAIVALYADGREEIIESIHDSTEAAPARE